MILIEIFEDTKMIDGGRAMDVVFMDFHGKLILNIKMHEIHGELVVWIQNWFTYRG